MKKRHGPTLALLFAACVPAPPPVTPPAGPPVTSTATPDVYLDHVSLVVDSLTFAAMLASTFLNDEFSAFAIRTTTSGDRSWTAIAMSGERTYLEFFAPGSGFGEAGAGALALSVEEPGALAVLQEAIRAIPGATPWVSERTGRMRGEEVRWFSALHVDYGDEASHARPGRWLMEYHADFVRRIAGDSVADGARSDLRRRLRVNRYDDTRLLGDVVGVVLETDSVDAARLEQELRVFGQTIQRRDATEFRAQELGVTVRRGTTGGAIRELRLTLTRPSPDTTSIVFGPSSVMRFLSDTTVVWTFTSPAP